MVKKIEGPDQADPVTVKDGSGALEGSAKVDPAQDEPRDPKVGLLKRLFSALCERIKRQR